jgi:hypothetical protein
LVDKIRGRSSEIRQSSQLEKLFKVMGYDSAERAKKIITNMTPEALQKLENKVKNMSTGKFTPDQLASIGMYGYDKAAIAKQAQEFFGNFGKPSEDVPEKSDPEEAPKESKPKAVNPAPAKLPDELKNINSIGEYATQRMGVNNIEMLRSMKKSILLRKLMRLSSDVQKLKSAGVSWAEELGTLNKELAKNAGVA